MLNNIVFSIVRLGMAQVLYCLAAALIAGLLVFMVMAVKLKNQKNQADRDVARYKQMLTDRMELESEGVNKLKKENEDLRKANENLRITVQTYSQKPGRKELQRLNVYQTAVDRLIINSPGFGAAWQAALKESEEEFEKTYVGVQAFIKKLIPIKTDAQVIREIEDKKE